MSDYSLASALPPDLWLEILTHLVPNDLLCVQPTCKLFSELQPEALQKYCKDHWPDIYAEVHQRTEQRGEAIEWWKLIQFLQLRDAELPAIVDVNAVVNELTVVKPKMRQAAVMLLLEACKELELGEDISCKAVRALDHYLLKKPLRDINRLQPLAYACLRAVLLHTAHPEGLLDPEEFLLTVSADPPVTPRTLHAATRDVQATVPAAALQAPSATTFQLCLFGILSMGDEGCRMSDMGVAFSLARALQNLALLDPQCSSLPPSLLATGTISLALRLTHQSPLPPTLLNTGYPPALILALHPAINTAHLSSPAPYVRDFWSRHCKREARSAPSPRLGSLWQWLHTQVCAPTPFSPNDILHLIPSSPSSPSYPATLSDQLFQPSHPASLAAPTIYSPPPTLQPIPTHPTLQPIPTLQSPALSHSTRPTLHAAVRTQGSCQRRPVLQTMGARAPSALPEGSPPFHARPYMPLLAGRS